MKVELGVRETGRMWAVPVVEGPKLCSGTNETELRKHDGPERPTSQEGRLETTYRRKFKI